MKVSGNSFGRKRRLSVFFWHCHRVRGGRYGTNFQHPTLRTGTTTKPGAYLLPRAWPSLPRRGLTVVADVGVTPAVPGEACSVFKMEFPPGDHVKRGTKGGTQ